MLGVYIKISMDGKFSLAEESVCLFTKRLGELRFETRESMNIVEFWSMALYCLFDFLGPMRSQLFVFVCDSSTTDA